MSLATSSPRASGLLLQPGRTKPIAGRIGGAHVGRIEAFVRGQVVEKVPTLVAAMFPVHAQSHRHCSELALAAARETRSKACGDEPAVLLETVRDHLRTVALQWPRQLEGGAGATVLQWLHACPVPLGSVPRSPSGDAVLVLRRFAEWFQRTLALDPGRWLQLVAADSGLAHWCEIEAARLPPARLLGSFRPAAQALRFSGAAGLVRAFAGEGESMWREIGQELAMNPSFATRPTWKGAPAETGPWLRLRDAGGPAFAGGAWTRLAAPWRELARIAQGTPGVLAGGGVEMGPGEGLGWCEMARGVLLHWARVDSRGRVEEYRVLEPADWNFHPEGAFVRALSQLPAGNGADARLVALAYEPHAACAVA